MHLVLYGASVSAQSKSDSVWLHLKAQAEQKLPLISISRLTFPSSTFAGPGYLCIDTLISLAPTHVVLDWLSTGEPKAEEFKLRTLYLRLYSLGIHIITISMPRADTWLSQSDFYSQCLEASVSCESSFIDMVAQARHLGLNIDDVTRDGVHTNERGAELAANQIVNALVEIQSNKEHIVVPPHYCELVASYRDNRQTWHKKSKFLDSFPVTSFSVGNELCLSYGQMCTMEFLVLESLPEACNMLEVWSLQTVGPYSPVLTASSDFHCQAVQLWDQWCHYERHSFKRIAVFSIPELPASTHSHRICFTISDLKPDRSAAQRSYDWPLPAEFKMRLHGPVYCLGGVITSLKVE